VKVHYEVYGSGKPIVMIHGFTPDSRLMIGCMEPLFNVREGYKRIYLDLPGMGKTKDYHHVNNTDEMLEVVLNFIDTIIPNRSFLIAGQSYGGYLTSGIISKRRELVEGAAFICPMVIPTIEKRTLPKHEIIKKDNSFLEKLSENEKEDFSSISVILDEYNWNRYKEEVLSGCQISDEAFLTKLKSQYVYTRDLDRTTFDRPSVFLLGKQDSMVGYKDAYNLLDYYPRASFAILDTAGHNLQIEQTHLFNSLINEWLDRVEQNS
jgi:pimeloyl-ACP methyl ester carboxylesterase